MSDFNELGASSANAFFEDLEKLLVSEIAKKPDNRALQLKLAELYSQTARITDFVAVARRIRELAGRHPERSDEWLRVLNMGRSLCPDEPLFTLSPSSGFAFEAPREEPPRHTRIGEEPRFKKPLEELATAYDQVRRDPRFIAELDTEIMQIAGAPSALQWLQRLSEQVGGAQIYVKRDDIGTRLSHITSAVVGQALLAKRMGKRALISFSRNGRSGVLVASIAARLGMKATVYMSAEQIAVQRSNVFRMWLCGADVQEAESGGRIGGDIRKAAFEDWARRAQDSLLIMGLDAGPHPYPMLTLELTSLVGRECRRQLYAQTRQAPDLVVARGGENADAIGLFPAFLQAAKTRLVCVTPAEPFDSPSPDSTRTAHQLDITEQQSLSIQTQQRATQILEGMDYPRVAREHAWLRATGRVEDAQIGAAAAKKAIRDMSHFEGIIPAIETAYAIAWACQTAARMPRDQTVMVLMAENVDKYIWDIGRAMGIPL